MDDASTSEEIDVIADDLSGSMEKMSGITSQLEMLSLKDFRGGRVELTIASTILRIASCLRSMNLVANASNPESAIVLSVAKQELQLIDRRFPEVVMKFEEEDIEEPR